MATTLTPSFFIFSISFLSSYFNRLSPLRIALPSFQNNLKNASRLLNLNAFSRFMV
ncbi:hypothetical protein 2200_scaffold2352_00002 [Bacteriophage sp.]|nr:hypothetical protein 2200_scaffold2352_00002 [Bacteriophage sp.]